MNLFSDQKTQSLHIRSKEDYTDIWLTPPEIIQALGEFDLDPCAHVEQPWQTAKTMFTIEDDGFSKEWFGRVWMNPPYSEIDRWMHKLSGHGNGIALTFARTETQYFHNHVWGMADAIFFFDGRLYFYRANGVKAKMNAGAPSVLIAYGEQNAEILRNCKLRGFYTDLVLGGEELEVLGNIHEGGQNGD